MEKRILGHRTIWVINYGCFGKIKVKALGRRAKNEKTAAKGLDCNKVQEERKASQRLAEKIEKANERQAIQPEQYKTEEKKTH